MAKKSTYRNMFNKSQNIESKKYNYGVFDQDEYSKNYATKNYRTIGFKLNVNTEADILSYIDYQEVLKRYIVNLIKKDMEEHPELLKEALEYDEACRIINDDPTRENVMYGDIIMKCPNCGHLEVLKLNDCVNLGETYHCPECLNNMYVVNASKLKLIKKIGSGKN